jgi:hypothetical protein
MVLLPMVEQVWVDEITKQSGLGDSRLSYEIVNCKLSH